MSDASEAQEPTDEDIAEVLGQEAVEGIPLPYGSHPTADVAQTVIRLANGAPEPIQQVANGLHLKDSSSASEIVDERTGDQDDETVESVILRFPKQWMRVYIRELMRCGSPSEARALASVSGGGISVAWVAKHERDYPEFARMAKEAMQSRHERVDHAVYRGATEGDEVPLVSQGAVIDTYKKRDTKAAIAYYQRHGLLAAQQVSVSHTGRVEVLDDAKVASALENVAKLLFGQPAPMKQAKVVSESDKKDA